MTTAVRTAEQIGPEEISAHGLHVVLLGTQGGPIPGTRAATSSALVVDGAVYVVDAGSGLPLRFSEAGLDFAAVRGMFITHLHSDHVSDYFAFFTLNWTNWDFEHQTVQVFGPGRAADHGPVGSDTPGLPDLDAPVVTPGLPTPGLRDVTDLSIRANAYDINQRLRSTRRRGGRPIDITGHVGRPMIEVHEIDVPGSAHVHDWAPRMDPISVFADEHVTVTAVLVDHPPVFPAFAYRFETAHGSVVFSGDTTPCANLDRLAAGADVLVNESMDVDVAIARFVGTPIYDTMAHQFTSAHTPMRSRRRPDGTQVRGVGQVATQCGVGALVLNHLFPGDGSVTNEQFAAAAAEHFDGPVFVGDDLMTVRLVATPNG